MRPEGCLASSRMTVGLDVLRSMAEMKRWLLEGEGKDFAPGDARRVSEEPKWETLRRPAERLADSQSQRAGPQFGMRRGLALARELAAELGRIAGS